MSKAVAVIILNRNLPDVTNQLCERILAVDGDIADVFVVEAGSDSWAVSRFASWRADWEEAIRSGLRFSRGMNFGLSQLWHEQKFGSYEAFMLLPNDVEFVGDSILRPLVYDLAMNSKIGIISPCSDQWGEQKLIPELGMRYFWFIHNTALMLRREFVESIANFEAADHMGFLFDGQNFRGYACEMELIAKAYANDWAAAITRKVSVRKNETHLLSKADLIKTEPYEENLFLYIEEGRRWLRQKYGFNSRWSMQLYTKYFYDKFFEFHPELNEFKI